MEAEAFNILVIEDDIDVARGIVRIARSIGEAFHVSTAAAANLALETRHNWGALVIDIALPDGSGLDVLSHARRGLHLPTPAAVFSGTLEPESANAAYELDATYITKSFTFAHLERFLRNASSTRRLSTPDIVAATVTAWQARYAIAPGEANVLLRAALGRSRLEIAEARGTSEFTVRDQERRVREKTGARSFVDAVASLLRDALRASLDATTRS